MQLPGTGNFKNGTGKAGAANAFRSEVLPSEALRRRDSLRRFSAGEIRCVQLAEEAVCCEPVSLAEFSDKWRITGNFIDLIPDRRFLEADIPHDSLGAAKSPPNSRGLTFRYRPHISPTLSTTMNSAQRAGGRLPDRRGHASPAFQRDRCRAPSKVPQRPGS